MTKEQIESRLNLANKVLATLGDYQLHQGEHGLRLSWRDWRGKEISRRWACGSNFYPSFHRKLACGGTQIVAIAQLARWAQGKTVLPFSTWKYWASLKLWTDNGKRDRALSLLGDSDWPKTPTCIACGRDLTKCCWDWWSLHGKEGPHCWGKCKEGDRPSPSP